jgi:NifU-like protein
MWDYTEKVMEHFYNPKNQGAIEETQENGKKVVTGEVGSIACGDALKLHLKIDEPTNKIVEARFQTFGCASAIASSSALTDMIVGMTVEQAMKVTNREIADYLGGLPEEKMHCSVMGAEALEAAIYTYKGIPLEAHDDDDESALICKCFGVTEGRIRRIVKQNKLTTAEQVTNYIKAGGGCTACLADIDDIVANVWEEAEADGVVSFNDFNVQVATDLAIDTDEGIHPPQRLLTPIQKINLIQEVLETEVRPFLKADGGDVELFDVEGDKVKVILRGACGSCPSSLVTLKVAVEAKLQEKVLPSLVVEAV